MSPWYYQTMDSPLLCMQVADVRRVWGMRTAFLLLDFEDSSAEPFKAMLLSATLQPLYINSDEVRRTLKGIIYSVSVYDSVLYLVYVYML